MPISIINAKGEQAVAEDPLQLDRRLAALPPEAPVMILLHGYRYSPSNSAADPHRQIFSLSPELRTQSWPRRLGFGRSPDHSAAHGLCIAFGWEAAGSLWRAYGEAGRAGVALAALITSLRARHHGPLHLIGHSLGAGVTLAALPRLAPGDVTRMVLLAGAEFCHIATAALQSPAGRSAEVLNVTSRENDFYDSGLEWLLAPLSGGRMLGAGLALPQAVTLQIDHAGHRAALRGLGFPTAQPNRPICRWSAYTRPGLFPFYRAFLRRTETLPLTLLRATLPATTSPRWSRLIIRPLQPRRIALQ